MEFTSNEIMDKVKAYFAKEIVDTEEYINKSRSALIPIIKTNTINQGLGVAFFAQTLGVEYEELS